MLSKIIYGKYVVTDADTIIPSGALYIEDDKIIDIGKYGDISKKYHPHEIMGSTDHIVTPGFVNAHGHGKGITDFQRGAVDNTLETWKFRNYPPIDVENDTTWTAIKYLESGITTSMHNHNLVNPENYYEEFLNTIKAYESTGIRTAFAPTFLNQNIFIYGDNDAFIKTLSQEQRDLCLKILQGIKNFGVDQYFEAINNLKEDKDSNHIKIMHGPLSPQWVTDDVLQEIKKHAQEEKMRIHIHTLQTQLQKLYGLKKYGKSLVGHLDDIGFLGENVTCGHCVWLSDEDINILADTKTSVTHHAGCNLRVRNGIAPVFELLRKGVVVGIGMDDKEFGDNKDFIEEMRLVSKLHRLPSHHLNSDHLLPVDCFRMGTQHSADTLGLSHLIGTLAKGKQADIVLLDLARMSEPFLYSNHNIIDLLVYRGLAMDVDTVLVGGKVLLKNRQLTRIDKKEVINKLKESIPEKYGNIFDENNRQFHRLKKSVASYFEPWYEEIKNIKKEPYYFMNNQH
jgi:cytosine/adenosine deaminase-related metal-dependent hydrolase